jgi:hypothetical protein
MVGDMFLMHEFRSIYGREDLGFTVALDTFAFRDMAIALNHIDMAPLAFHPSLNILPMVERPSFDFDVPFWLHMAGNTTSHCAGDTLFFSLRACPVIMTDEAVDLMDGEMSSLNQLGMAGSAAKFHSPSQLPKVLPVGENHILIDHILLKSFYLVASSLKTACIADLCMRFGWPFAGEEIGKRHLAIHPLAFEMVYDSWLIVALCAGDMAVAGGPPGVHIDIHLVTETAERGTLGKPQQGKGKNDEQDDANRERRLDGPVVFLGSFLKIQIDIGPKGLD